MPTGVYAHADGTVEHFSCAMDPSGWRYDAEVRSGAQQVLGRVALVCDTRWRAVRLELQTPGWLLRGGVVGLELRWLRAPVGGLPDPADERVEQAVGFVGTSPGLVVALSRSLGLDPGGEVRTRCVAVSGPALATARVSQRWTLAAVEDHPAEVGALAVERFEVDDLDSGVRRVLHVAGDVLVAADDVELVELTGPPSPVRR